MMPGLAFVIVVVLNVCTALIITLHIQEMS